jgi:perosamine synthetase
MFRYNPAGFGDHSREEFLNALRAEGVPCRGGYLPLYKHRIFESSLSGTGPWCPSGRSINYAEVTCPECERASEDSVWLTQNMLLGTEDDMDDIAAAIRKIQAAWN